MSPREVDMKTFFGADAHVGDVELGAAMARGPGAGDHDFRFSIFLPGDFQALMMPAPEMMAVPCWSSRGTRDVHLLLELLLDVEALGGLDIFEVDAAEGGLHHLHGGDECVGVGGVELMS
jgi:hypothetical protein